MNSATCHQVGIGDLELCHDEMVWITVFHMSRLKKLVRWSWKPLITRLVRWSRTCSQVELGILGLITKLQKVNWRNLHRWLVSRLYSVQDQASRIHTLYRHTYTQCLNILAYFPQNQSSSLYQLLMNSLRMFALTFEAMVIVLTVVKIWSFPCPSTSSATMYLSTHRMSWINPLPAPVDQPYDMTPYVNNVSNDASRHQEI